MVLIGDHRPKTKMNNKNFILACLLALTCLVSATEESLAGECASPPTAISSVRVFDGEKIIPAATVVIECSKIRAVLAQSEAIEITEDTNVIDGNGKTLLPGLIDAHAHVFGRGTLERALDFGVTTLLDTGSMAEGFVRKIKDENANGPATDRADLFSAVLWVTAPGSHGTQWGEVRTLSDPADASGFVAELVGEGADYIKVIYDNFKMFDDPIPTLSKETMFAVVAAAHEQGKMAVFHSRDVEAFADVVAAGGDGFVHAPVDEVPGEELIAAMLEAGVFVSPNFSLARPDGKRLVDDPVIGPMLTEREIENLQGWRALRREGGDVVEYESVMAFHTAGIPILVGSDIPNGGTATGASVHLEMELMVEAGFTPIEALAAATSSTATAYGLEDRGRIAPGMNADLILVDGKPDEAITDSRRIDKIWKAGVLHQ